jgi:hypothetical protein
MLLIALIEIIFLENANQVRKRRIQAIWRESTRKRALFIHTSDLKMVNLTRFVRCVRLVRKGF